MGARTGQFLGPSSWPEPDSGLSMRGDSGPSRAESSMDTGRWLAAVQVGAAEPGRHVGPDSHWQQRPADCGGLPVGRDPEGEIDWQRFLRLAPLPAKAGIQRARKAMLRSSTSAGSGILPWIPTFAGMTPFSIPAESHFHSGWQIFPCVCPQGWRLCAQPTAKAQKLFGKLKLFARGCVYDSGRAYASGSDSI